MAYLIMQKRTGTGAQAIDLNNIAVATTGNSKVLNGAGFGIKPDGTTIATFENNNRIEQRNFETAADASTINTTPLATITGGYFSGDFTPDGTGLFTLYYTGSAFHFRAISLSTPYDLSTATQQTSFAPSVGTLSNTDREVFVYGTRIFVSVGNGVVKQWDYSWDGTTLSVSNYSFVDLDSTLGLSAVPVAIAVVEGGSSILTLESDNTLKKFSLSVNGDIVGSTKTLTQTTTLPGPISAMESMQYSDTLRTLFINRSTNLYTFTF